MEMGAAWFVDKLIVSVVESRDVPRLPQPLIGNQAVPLDDRLHIVRLIDAIGASIGRPRAPDAEYEAEMASLLSWTRRFEPLRRRARTAARGLMAAVAALLLVSYLLSRQNVEGQVYRLNENLARVKINGATLYVDSQTKGVVTNDQGAFTFSVWNAFPRPGLANSCSHGTCHMR